MTRNEYLRFMSRLGVVRFMAEPDDNGSGGGGDTEPETDNEGDDSDNNETADDDENEPEPEADTEDTLKKQVSDLKTQVDAQQSLITNLADTIKELQSSLADAVLNGADVDTEPDTVSDIDDRENGDALTISDLFKTAEDKED